MLCIGVCVCYNVYTVWETEQQTKTNGHILYTGFSAIQLEKHLRQFSREYEYSTLCILSKQHCFPSIT